jgi:hypothetical protein
MITNVSRWFIMPSALKIIYIGMISAMGGIICVNSDVLSNGILKRKRKREYAYAASTPKTNDIHTTETVTTTLLVIAGMKSLFIRF